MAQYGVPISDITKVNWLEVTGDGDGDAFDELDEGIDSGTPDDTTTEWRSASGNLTPITCRVTSLTDPSSSSSHIYKVRCRKDISGGQQIDLDTYLYQNGTQITTDNYTNVDNVYTTRGDTLTSTEADNITDYTVLECSLLSTQVGGGQTRRGRVTAMEFECPSVVSFTPADKIPSLYQNQSAFVGEVRV